MKLLATPREISRALTRLLDEYAEYYWAVAWATTSAVAAELLARKDRIRRLVVGTDFYQTDPGFLAHFLNDKAVHVVPAGGVTFHPKVYLFADAGFSRWSCVIGSPNFTAAALTRNVECTLLISERDDPDGRTLRQLRAALKDYWDQGKPFSASDLDVYRIAYKNRKPRIDRLTKKPRIRLPKPGARHGDLLNIEWPAYARLVRADANLEERLKLLGMAREALTLQPDYALMSPEVRRRLAGTARGKGSDSERYFGGVDWWLFGSMGAVGEFTTRVNNRPDGLAAALANIPSVGEVTEDHYLSFVESWRDAFAGAVKVGHVPAMRLLAMKRPDYFVCIDSENRSDLCKDFGIAQNGITLESYWDLVVSPVLDSVWWNSAPPARRGDRAIWEGRVALLDSLYYRP